MTTKAKTKAEERVLRAAVRYVNVEAAMMAMGSGLATKAGRDLLREVAEAEDELRAAVRALERERAGKGGK
jgi:hypothetical protein